MDACDTVIRYLCGSICPHDKNRMSSRYDGQKIPPITVRDYIVRLFVFGKVSNNGHLAALILLCRWSMITGITLDLLNVHRLYAVSLRVSSKIVDDENLDNAAFSEVIGTTNPELNALERTFLKDICWDLYISEGFFKHIIHKMSTQSTWSILSVFSCSSCDCSSCSPDSFSDNPDSIMA